MRLKIKTLCKQHESIQMIMMKCMQRVPRISEWKKDGQIFSILTHSNEEIFGIFSLPSIVPLLQVRKIYLKVVKR